MTSLERAIDRIEEFIAGEVGFHDPAMREQATDLLDALLAPETIPCPCVGFDRHGQEFAKANCPTCHGTGSVVGEPLLIERDRLERAEYVDVERMAQDGRAQFPAGDTAMTRRAAEPLYRLRDVNEGEGQ